MNKTIPLKVKATLRVDAKNEAKVKPTREKLAKSTHFSAYNLRWNSFSSILNDSIIGNLFCQELCSKMRALGLIQHRAIPFNLGIGFGFKAGSNVGTGTKN